MKRRCKEKNGFEPLYKKIKFNCFLDEICTIHETPSSKFFDCEISNTIFPNNDTILTKKKKNEIIKLRNNKYRGSIIWSEQMLQNYYRYHLMNINKIGKLLKNLKYPRFHECITGNCKLVFDVDVNIDENFTEEHKIIIYELKKLILHINKSLKNDFNIDINKVLIFDSSRFKKISFHVIYHHKTQSDIKFIFLNITQVGIYLSKILYDIKNSNYILKNNLFDFNIYSEGHFLRTYFSVKGTDSSSRLVVYDSETQKYNHDIFKESLVTYLPVGKYKCIKIEDVNSFNESYFYQRYISDDTYKPKNNIISPVYNFQKKEISLNNIHKQFFDFCNMEFKNVDKTFDCRDYSISKTYMSNFGKMPFIIPNTNIKVVKGPSFCMEVYGKYCLRHKRYHENAKTKTYYYFPYSDKKSNKYHNIFKLYYRCNFRYKNESCFSLEIKNKKMFVNIHKNLIMLLK